MSKTYSRGYKEDVTVRKSSHWEWAERKVQEHKDNKPFAPENGKPLRFRAGDRVLYTNLYGVEFELKVIRLYAPGDMDDLNYALGARYVLDGIPRWFPTSEEFLTPLGRCTYTHVGFDYE